jgi:ferric-dicitrate binding protein FerR (iron transport regulator)
MNSKHDQLMLKKVIGTITEEEEQVLEAWINSDPGARKRYEAFCARWNQNARNAPEFSPQKRPSQAEPFVKRRKVVSKPLPRNQPAPQPHPNQQPIPPRQARPAVTSKGGKRFKVAEGVAVTLVCVSSFFLFLGLKDYPQLYEAKGQHKTFYLPDSSMVTLKSGSAIKVSGHYLDATRTVYLYGGGYFNVKDVPKPFVVITENAELRSNASSFVVNSAGSGEGEVSSLKGDVRIVPAGNQWRRVLVSSGQKGTVDAQGKRVVVTSFDTLNALAWKEKLLVFNKTPMEEAIPALEDYFGVRFELDNPDIANCKLSRTFRDPNIMEVIEVLRRGVGVTVTREPGVSILEGKGCKIGQVASNKKTGR